MVSVPLETVCLSQGWQRDKTGGTKRTGIRPEEKFKKGIFWKKIQGKKTAFSGRRFGGIFRSPVTFSSELKFPIFFRRPGRRRGARPVMGAKEKCNKNKWLDKAEFFVTC